MVRYRKKMNFTTDLPKKLPVVSYIVASAIRCTKQFPESAKEGPVFRMHAVILKSKLPAKNYKGTGTGKWTQEQNAAVYILCHVRKVMPTEATGDALGAVKIEKPLAISSPSKSGISSATKKKATKGAS
jgi:hypothetical protein